LHVDRVSVDYRSKAGPVRVVEDVSFDLATQRSIAVIGESGSGKTTLALAIAGLVPAKRATVSGHVLVDGVDMVASPAGDVDRIRGRRIGFVFQDPLSSLNPVKTVGDQVAELFRAHRGLGKREAMAAAVEVLARVRIPDPQRRAHEYPHQFSGGMRQRVMLAIALALDPALLIADEPTTALDVTVQAQIIELLEELRREAETALVLISHDLGVAAALAERLAVMYGGRLVEIAPLREAYRMPYHPYTRGLLDSGTAGDTVRLVPIPGAPPQPRALPSGCAFHPRCTFAVARCRTEVPPLREMSTGRFVACHEAETVVQRPRRAG
jgi:oligopeptide/dipeptide ABC transporter ATP-binding protein